MQFYTRIPISYNNHPSLLLEYQSVNGNISQTQPNSNTNNNNNNTSTHKGIMMMMEQQRKGSKVQMFGRRDSKSLQDNGCQSAMGTSSGIGGSSSSSSSSGIGSKSGGLASRLGFKFEVTRFDINAVSPTSW